MFPAGFFIPFLYLPILASDLGYEKSEGASLIMIIGIANTIGRVLAGCIADQMWTDSLLINNFSLVVGGIATICVPFITRYEFLGVYSFVFGCCIGGY